MRYKNKEKFNKGIMKSIKKKQEKEEIKIINYNLPSIPNENNKNNNNNNQNMNSNNDNNLANCSNYITNSTLRQNILGRKIPTQKESYLKKALDNMANIYLNKSEDSKIFNMEKHDQITDNIILEKEKTSQMSRKYLENKVQKKNSFNRKFSSNIKNDFSVNENELNNRNVFGNIKKEIEAKDKPIELKDENYNKNLLNDLQGPTIDFYKKRMDYLSNLYLNVKNSPFEYLETDENSTKKKFSKYIPKSATIFKERKDNFNVHLIKKFSDFKVALNKQTSVRSKTANLKNKISKLSIQFI